MFSSTDNHPTQHANVEALVKFLIVLCSNDNQNNTHKMEEEDTKQGIAATSLHIATKTRTVRVKSVVTNNKSVHLLAKLFVFYIACCSNCCQSAKRQAEHFLKLHEGKET